MAIVKSDEFEPFFFENEQNGQLAWPEASFMEFLGYRDKRSFRKAVNRAIQAWASIGNAPGRDFILLPDDTYKFTRSACFLIALNGDSKKPKVAQAQAYFVALGNVMYDRRDQAESIDRLVVRDEVTAGMKALAATAKDHGVMSYGRFVDEGYRGMYNMSLKDLSRMKGVPAGEHLLDRMDREELAANLFRVTQTEAKIRKETITGQDALEKTAHSVGETVRKTMIELSGTEPEKLKIAVLIVRVSAEEKLAIDSAAERSGEKTSVWVRRVLLKASSR